jgi:hypothetical protein
LNSGVASSGLALNSGVASSGLALSGEMHAEVALTKCRATTAEAQARRQANQFKGMRWPLQCMHQAITKNKKPADQGGFGAWGPGGRWALARLPQPAAYQPLAASSARAWQCPSGRILQY